MIRALVVDDEALARERLRRLLEEAGTVEIVGEAADGLEAMAKIAELSPAAVFLDIQMPGCTGLEVAASLPDPRPHIVFCTAFDQYAIDAFELHAVDYLLKPVSRARLQKALDRLRSDATPGAVDAAVRAAAPVTRFLARKGAAYRVVPAQDVLCFVSESGLTKLVAAGADARPDGRVYLIAPTLNELESRVDPQKFFRISRAALVNLDAVHEVTPTPGGYGEVTLRDGTRLEVSRRRFKDLTDRLGA
jgi:two-component system LytT family response regulator